MLSALDNRLLRVMRTRGHHPRVEAAIKAVAASGEWGAIWCASGLVAAALDAPRSRRWLLAAALGPATIGVNFLFKLAFRRARPVLEDLPALGRAPSALSFPSAHASSSFAAAAAMSRVAPAARVPLFSLAILMCLTRPYLGMHYPSDVLAGAALGLAVGHAVPGLNRPDRENGAQ